jgi:hypothetical protein
MTIVPVGWHVLDGLAMAHVLVWHLLAIRIGGLPGETLCRIRTRLDRVWVCLGRVGSDLLGTLGGTLGRTTCGRHGRVKRGELLHHLFVLLWLVGVHRLGMLAEVI